MIAIDAGGLFDGIFNNTLQETLLILIHEVTRSKHKSIIKKGFHRYLNKEKIINSADKGIIHQLPQGVFFALYDCNSVPVDGTDLDLSVVAIGIELPFPIDLSPARPRKGTSEKQQHLCNFEA